MFDDAIRQNARKTIFKEDDFGKIQTIRNALEITGTINISFAWLELVPSLINYRTAITPGTMELSAFVKDTPFLQGREGRAGCCGITTPNITY